MGWSPGGYTVGPWMAQPTAEPLVSPNHSGWWRTGTDIAKRGWKPLATLQAAGVVLSMIVTAPLAVYIALVEDDFNEALAVADPDNAPDLSPLLTLLGLTFASVLVTIIVTGIVVLATVHVGASVANHADVRIADALRLAGRRLLPMLGWHLVAIPIYLVAVCLCFFPVLYVSAVFAVLPVVVAVERTNAISRCFSLFHGDLGASAGRVATILGLAVAAGLAAVLIGVAVDEMTRANMPGSAGIVGGAVASTLLSSVISGAVAILLAPLTLGAYADMRARRDPPGGPTIAQQLGIMASAIASWTPWSTGQGRQA
jgi:hypothetical protein